MILWGPEGGGLPAAPLGCWQMGTEGKSQTTTQRLGVWGTGRSLGGWDWDGLPGPGWVLGFRTGTALLGEAPRPGESCTWRAETCLACWGVGWGDEVMETCLDTSQRFVMWTNPSRVGGSGCVFVLFFDPNSNSVVGGGAGLSLEFIAGLLM